jgi:hypothetical protein
MEFDLKQTDESDNTIRQMSQNKVDYYNNYVLRPRPKAKNSKIIGSTPKIR